MEVGSPIGRQYRLQRIDTVFGSGPRMSHVLHAVVATRRGRKQRVCQRPNLMGCCHNLLLGNRLRFGACDTRSGVFRPNNAEPWGWGYVGSVKPTGGVAVTLVSKDGYATVSRHGRRPAGLMLSTSHVGTVCSRASSANGASRRWPVGVPRPSVLHPRVIWVSWEPGHAVDL